MAAGLFGKLPAKRDFIAARTSRRFLEVWEPWIQSGMATSKVMLGDGWNEAFNRAPIWRFWLGEAFCGQGVIGAFMPSIDGVGRLFPLTILSDESEGSAPPPEIEANDAWFDAAEGILLDALENGAAFETIAAAAAELAPPKMEAPASGERRVDLLPDGVVVTRDAGGETGNVFAQLRRVGCRRLYASQSFWWTIGGEDFPPISFALSGLPPARRFADMLTGAFAAALEPGEQAIDAR